MSKQCAVVGIRFEGKAEDDLDVNSLASLLRFQFSQFHSEDGSNKFYTCQFNYSTSVRCYYRLPFVREKLAQNLLGLMPCFENRFILSVQNNQPFI